MIVLGELGYGVCFHRTQPDRSLFLPLWQGL